MVCALRIVRWWQRPRDRQAAAPPIARAFKLPSADVQQQIIPLSNTPEFLTGVVRRRNTAPYRDELSRSLMPCRGGELRRRADCAAGNCAPRPGRHAGPRPDSGDRPGAEAQGHRTHARVRRTGSFGRDAAGAFSTPDWTDIAVWADPDGPCR